MGTKLSLPEINKQLTKEEKDKLVKEKIEKMNKVVKK